jgi:hypothetical protein
VVPTVRVTSGGGQGAARLGVGRAAVDASAAGVALQRMQAAWEAGGWMGLGGCVGGANTSSVGSVCSGSVAAGASAGAGSSMFGGGAPTVLAATAVW